MSDEIDTIEIGTGALARLLSMSAQRVGQLVAAGVLQKIGRGRFKLEDAVTAYVRFLRSQPVGTDGAGAPLDYAVERARLTRLQADRVELDLARDRGRLVEIEQVVEPFAEQCQIIRNGFLVLPAKCTPRVLGQDFKTVHGILQSEVHRILNELSSHAEEQAKETQDDQ